MTSSSPSAPPPGVSPKMRELLENALTARGAFSAAICAAPELFDDKAVAHLESVDAEAEAALFQAIATLEAQNEAMRFAGGRLSNAAFNLSQPSVTLTDAMREGLKYSQLEWDAALSTPPGTDGRQG